MIAMSGEDVMDMAQAAVQWFEDQECTGVQTMVIIAYMYKSFCRRFPEEMKQVEEGIIYEENVDQETN